MIHVCVPVLKRYDLLRQLLFSLEKSTVIPNRVFIIDNGQDGPRMKTVIDSVDLRTDIYTPKVPMGVAESWNWFIQNVPEERVIANDDIVFAPDSLEKLLASSADLIWAAGCGFSCYVIRDTCVAKVGLFDEEISPGYGYYEDEDYLQRLDGRGTKPAIAHAEEVEAAVIHHKSATLQAASHDELLEHHRKFLRAQGNYARKWGVKF